MKLLIPVMICAILAVSVIRKKPSYELFIDGAGDGLKMLKNILPPMIAVMTAVYMMRASGLLEITADALSGVTEKIGFPNELIPLAIIRPLSGSGALGVFSDILNRFGADSKIGKIASVMCGSTETTFYCLCVYFSRTRVKNTLKTVPFAVFGDLVCLAMALWITALI